MPNIVIICLLVICVALSAFFSGSEIVYANVNKIRLKKMAENGNKKAQNAWHLAENFPVLISTILIGNNLVNIAASSLSTILFVRIWPENGALLAGFIITSIILIFGEILPKTILSKFSTKVSILFYNPLIIFSFIFKPLVFVITKLIDKISPLWTPKPDLEEEDTSGEELINMVETIRQEGFIDNDTQELLTSAIEFKDTTAQEIMQPRVDVFAVDVEDNVSDLMKNEEIFTYSRVLVYEDTVDNIIGVLSTKRLILDVLSGNKVNIRNMLTKPILVHKTKSITSILKVFKDSGTHIAIVVDEFGGTLGIITLEDVLEEIVGDIWDEMDEVEEEIVETSDGSYIVDGDMNIFDMFDMVGYKYNDDFECAYDTVAGWCTEILDDFPKKNDHFDFDNLSVTIIETEGVRVVSVKIEVKEIEE